MFSTELQYTVVRYMLNDLGDEAANVGLIAATIAPFRVLFRLMDDPTIKSRNDARVSRDAVQRFARRAQTLIAQPAPSPSDAEVAAALFDQLRDMGAGLVRLTPPRSVLTNDPNAEFELLYAQWVAPRAGAIAHRLYGPRDPLGGLRKEAAAALLRAFRQGYGRPLSRKVFSRSYEVRGASSHVTTFDLALRSGTRKKPQEHLFHHLLLLPDAEDSYTQAAALCWRWQDVRAANHAHRQLTAVLYERPEQRSHGVADATKLLRQEQIEAVGLNRLPAVARTIEGQLTID